jgi:hypothetical protein
MECPGRRGFIELSFYSGFPQLNPTGLSYCNLFGIPSS